MNSKLREQLLSKAEEYWKLGYEAGVSAASGELRGIPWEEVKASLLRDIPALQLSAIQEDTTVTPDSENRNNDPKKTSQESVTMPENTRSSELDEILKLHASYHYGGGREGELSDGKAKQSILDWHNKQVEAVLDRLRSDAVYGEYSTTDDDSEQGEVVPVMAIEAERKRINKTEKQ